MAKTGNGNMSSLYMEGELTPAFPTHLSQEVLREIVWKEREIVIPDITEGIPVAKTFKN